MAKTSKWQDEIIERLNKSSNKELFEWLLNIAGGDDYDGCFTSAGEWEYLKVKEEISNRLSDWLKK